MIVDGHLDLALNALNYSRDLLQPIGAVRAREPQMVRRRETPTVSFVAMQQAGIGVALASLFAMPKSLLKQYDNWQPSLAYDDRQPVPIMQEQAFRIAMHQLDYYHRLADENSAIELITNWSQVGAIAESMTTPAPKVGIVVHMEGADAIRDAAEVELWYERGLRSIGLAWSDTVYAAGQWRGNRSLTNRGRQLLERMQALNMLCDLTHMAEEATYDVFDHYEGPLCATHCNARALTPGARQLSDQQIALLAERDGIIGVVLFNKFLRRGHGKGDDKQLVSLRHVVEHIDHICQVSGDALHVGIGSDMDGGFGYEDIPQEMDSIADLPKIAAALQEYGYDDGSVRAVMGDNWLRLLQRVLAN